MIHTFRTSPHLLYGAALLFLAGCGEDLPYANPGPAPALPAARPADLITDLDNPSDAAPDNLDNPPDAASDVVPADLTLDLIDDAAPDDLVVDDAPPVAPDDNRCPVAVARGRVRYGDPAEERAEGLYTHPLQAIELSPEGSYDPDDGDAITRHAWAILEEPVGARPELVTSRTGATLTPWIAGRYLVELTVYDRFDTPSCQPARVTIDATRLSEIHYELSWDTDGTDVDSHFLHPNGRWNASPWDLYYLNRSPNWGSRPRDDDDPSLDIDDTDGFGPESASLDNPERVTYRLGAFYFSDHGKGATNVTARVFLRGVLAFEHRDKPLTDGQFWEAATVTWGDTPTADAVDRVTEGFPPEP